jgi:DNA-binding XRE family transcriptional regulator
MLIKTQIAAQQKQLRKAEQAARNRNRDVRARRAEAWRERLGLTKEQLADLTGFTAITIYWFERGETPPKRNAKGGHENDRRIKDWVWMRWQRACGDVDAEINGRVAGEKFRW